MASGSGFADSFAGSLQVTVAILITINPLNDLPPNRIMIASVNSACEEGTASYDTLGLLLCREMTLPRAGLNLYSWTDINIPIQCRCFRHIRLRTLALIIDPFQIHPIRKVDIRSLKHNILF